MKNSIDKIEARNIRADRLIEKNLQGTGCTYGYIGNLESWGDDRAWSIRLPHPGRPGNKSDIIGGGYSTADRWKLAQVAANFRKGFDHAKKVKAESRDDSLRKQILSWLQHNDRNGAYIDEECEAEFGRKLTLIDAVELISEVLAEG